MSAAPMLRIEYAKAALVGMLAHPTRYRVKEGSPADLRGASWHQAIAEEAFQIADAMQAAERARPESPLVGTPPVAWLHKRVVATRRILSNPDIQPSDDMRRRARRKGDPA